MNYLKIFIDVFSSGIDTIAIYIFFNAVLRNKRFNEKITMLMYTMPFVALSFIAVVINNSLLRLGSMLLIFIAVTLFYKSSFFVKIFVCILFTVFAVLAEILTGIFLAVITQKSAEVLSTNIVYYMEGVLISKAVLLMIVKAIQYKKLPADSKLITKHFLPMISLPLTTMFIIYLMSEYAYTLERTKSVISVAIAAVMLIASNLLVFYLLEKQLRQEAAEQKLTLVQQQLQYQTQYYKELSDIYKLSNKTVHDTKNQLFAISIALTNNDVPKAKSKINELCNNVLGSSNSIKTGNDALDALLNTKLREIEDKKIKFAHNIFINGKNQIDDIDFCIIMGNALDNAVEACSKIAEISSRNITLKMMQADDHLAIEMTNSAFGKSENITGKLLTDKKEKHLHGFGLQSIDELVNKYNGILSYSQDDGVFTLKIYMQNHIE